MTHIEIRGARTHNLKGIDVDVPKHRLVAFTGVSGSGKSSLVFDTICTEAQRQLVETFSTYARRRLPQLTRPPVDAIRNISPCIVIDQKRLGASSRSTVGTVTEVYTYLRMLFSRCGRPHAGWSHRFSFNHPDGMCPACKGLGKRIAVDVDKLLDLDRSVREGAILHPGYDVGKWYWREIVHAGVVPVDKPLRRFTEAEMQRLLWADGVPVEHVYNGETYERTFDGVARKLERLHVDKDEDQMPEVRRQAYRRLFTARTCPDCGGARLNAEALAAELAGGWTIGRLVESELSDLDGVLKDLVEGDDYAPIHDVVATLVGRMRRTLRHLIDIGVGYLSLNRGVPTLSGGESQRVKMARQLDCDLVDLVYILDEPTVGLHPRDIDHLVAMLHRLRDQGNSVLVVEHDPAVIRAADWIVDIGPGAGDGGGEVVFSGRLAGLKRAGGATARAEAQGRPAEAEPPTVQGHVPRHGSRLQQPAQRLRRDTEGRADVRHRRRRVRQELARGGAHRDSAGPRRVRGRRRRPAAGRPLVPVEPRHLRRRARRHPADLRRRQPRLSGAVQLQLEGVMPGMQGPRLPPGRAVVPRRRSPRLQGLRRPALSRGGSRADLARPLHPRRAGDDGFRRPGVLRIRRRRQGASRGHSARTAASRRGLQLLVDVGVGYLRLGQSSGCHGFALDERQDFRGCRHRSPGNRAKSPSVVIHSQPCSMATAASQASGTRLPLAPAASHSRRKIRQWSRPGETETRLGRVLSSSANRIASARELGVA